MSGGRFISALMRSSKDGCDAKSEACLPLMPNALSESGKGIKTVLGGVDAIKASGMFEEGNIKEL